MAIQRYTGLYRTNDISATLRSHRRIVRNGSRYSRIRISVHLLCSVSVGSIPRHCIFSLTGGAQVSGKMRTIRKNVTELVDRIEASRTFAYLTSRSGLETCREGDVKISKRLAPICFTRTRSTLDKTLRFHSIGNVFDECTRRRLLYATHFRCIIFKLSVQFPASRFWTFLAQKIRSLSVIIRTISPLANQILQSPRHNVVWIS